ncbi:SDR family NAD(P)-dependent oxidoreductase [Evansella cellulosilytica]|uniref:Saccharopine dehydrogenase n=1 Tax=Evansella cellulosilytica (strain ATCC 21833 / DSM 2522 / FERM P-1141 / JCM 9156 / N-4) TaxID=649639 RepID=E6TYZ3_EVAC2|nr:SDR family NAD(P)-dependent oxidoreductase [Evansella cellulosilytica]ADU32436.1 Saccharopine dehydrogenase [Evansella cellulosilytica DSM 2522]
MKKALVLGATGGIGYSIVKELVSRDIEVIAFSRTEKKLTALFGDNEKVTIFSGDVFNRQALLDAAEDVDVIFHALNIPYADWEEKLSKVMGNILYVAEKQLAKVAIADNIYAYGRAEGVAKVTEETEKNPHTKKGKIRLKVEKQAKDSNVPVLIAHFPDFYGPNAESAILQYTLDAVVKGKKASFVGNQSVKREYIFTPDGAKAIVELASRDDAYGQNWNIPGADIISGHELVKILRGITGYNKKVGTVTKRMIQFIGIFNAQMREVVEMLYLTETPVVLSGEKYEREIGEIPRTSYKDGLHETISFMKNKEAVKTTV